jgi:hypothetical protein
MYVVEDTSSKKLRSDLEKTYMQGQICKPNLI